VVVPGREELAALVKTQLGADRWQFIALDDHASGLFGLAMSNVNAAACTTG